MPVQEEVLKYLDGVAQEITKIADNPPKAKNRPVALAKALNLNKDASGQGSFFTDYLDRWKRKIAMDAFFEVRECDNKDGAFNFLVDKYKRAGHEISKATVGRIYESYLLTWQAKVEEMRQCGMIGPVGPDGKRLLNFTIAGDSDELKEGEIILALIKDTFHELP